MLSCTIALSRLAILKGSELEWREPAITIAFPPQYPESAPPNVTEFVAIDNLDTEHRTVVATCFEENVGEECVMQLVQSFNEHIELQNERVAEENREGTKKRQEAEREKQEAKSIFDAAQQDAAETAQAMVVPVLGRRVINSPYIVKPAKIKDVKKCAEELQLGGYAKVGKPGIIVIEGAEEACRKYVPMLQDLGWKYQTEQGEQQQQGPAGTSVDSLRVLPAGFEVLGEDTMSELSQLCRDAGLADLFFTSLNIHDSVGAAGAAGKKGEAAAGKKTGGKRAGGR
jgi:hypothetical protein